MKTIALRFGEHFSPDCGTIAAHQAIIDEFGHVWYGKMGASVSSKIQSEVMSNDSPKILLIRSGRAERYWAYISEITKEMPPASEIPEYYRSNSAAFKTWFKILRFEMAEKDVMSKFVVSSSKAPLGSVSRHSMSPYFIIEKEDAHELGK